MIKKTLAILTSVVAALVVVGVAWASDGAGSSTSVTSADSSTSASLENSTPSAAATTPASTPSTGVASTTSTSASGSTSTSAAATTSTSTQGTTSTSNAASTSTSPGGTTSTSSGGSSTTSTTVDSTTSTSVDDTDASVPNGFATHLIPGVGSVTTEVFEGRLFLTTVSAPGWDVEHHKIESDRIELRFTSRNSKAQFEATLHHGRVEVKIEVDRD